MLNKHKSAWHLNKCLFSCFIIYFIDSFKNHYFFLFLAQQWKSKKKEFSLSLSLSTHWDSLKDNQFCLQKPKRNTITTSPCQCLIQGYRSEPTDNFRYYLTRFLLCRNFLDIEWLGETHGLCSDWKGKFFFIYGTICLAPAYK